MSYSKTTPNFKLPQYTANDEPNWLVDTNHAYATIDTSMEQIDVLAQTGNNTATEAKTLAEQLETQLETTNSNVSTLTDNLATTNTTLNTTVTRVTGLETGLNAANTQISENTQSIAQLENAKGISMYSHEKVGTVHHLTGDGVNGMFYSNAAFAAGDTFSVNGVATAAIYQSGDTLPENLFINNVYVRFTLANENIYFFG